MKVKQLKKKLEKLPDDMEVMILQNDNYGEYTTKVSKALIQIVEISKTETQKCLVLIEN